MALEIFILLMAATKTKNHMQIFHNSTIEMRKNIERIKIAFIISVEQKREKTLRLRLNVQSKVTAEGIASISDGVDAGCHSKPFKRVSLHDSSAKVKLELFKIVLDLQQLVNRIAGSYFE